MQKCIKPLLQTEAVKIDRRHILLGVFIAGSLIVTAPLVTAGSSNQPYHVKVTKSYVQATAKCSCGRGTWYYETVSFVNYCPQCHRHGTLHYRKYSDAGQWTCSHCDCDFCMQCGKEKLHGTELWLRQYTQQGAGKDVTNNSVVAKNATVQNSTNSTPGNITNSYRENPGNKVNNLWLNKYREIVISNLNKDLWALV